MSYDSLARYMYTYKMAYSGADKSLAPLNSINLNYSTPQKIPPSR